MFMLTRKQAPNHKMTRALLSLFVVFIVMQSLPVLRASAQTSVEGDFMTILNTERAKMGKNSFAINSYLSTAASLHSKDMAEQGYFSHTSVDGRTFDQRIIAAGYTEYASLGENIAYAYGAPDAARVYGMWKNSTGHYANMMGDFSDAGLGVYSKNGYTYYTLDLGKSRSVTPPPSADFALGCSPSDLTASAGSTVASIFTVKSHDGFSGTIALTATAPAGWTFTLTPISIAVTSNASLSSTLSVMVPSTVQSGASTITVTATSGSKSHSAAVTVTVQEPALIPEFPFTTISFALLALASAFAQTSMEAHSNHKE